MFEVSEICVAAAQKVSIAARGRPFDYVNAKATAAASVIVTTTVSSS